MQYKNYTNAHAEPPPAAAVPQLTIGTPSEITYAFTFPPTQVPWGGLEAGAIQEVASAIHAGNSAGQDKPGLDPGAQQCHQTSLFEIVLLNVKTWDLNPIGPIDGIQIADTPAQPFGVCAVNPSCPPS